MATCVHLSMYLLLVINLSPFKLFDAASTIFRTASVKPILNPRQRNTLFSLKEEKLKQNDFNFT